MEAKRQFIDDYLDEIRPRNSSCWRCRRRASAGTRPTFRSKRLDPIKQPHRRQYGRGQPTGTVPRSMPQAAGDTTTEAGNNDTATTGAAAVVELIDPRIRAGRTGEASNWLRERLERRSHAFEGGWLALTA